MVISLCVEQNKDMKTPPPKPPFYAHLAVILLPPLLVFFLSIISIIFLGIKTIDENEIDKLLHLLGGVSISFFGAGVLWNLTRRNIVELKDANVFRVIVFGFNCFAVISWEFFEYILDLFPAYLTYSDTIIDMMFGLIGGMVAIFFLRRPIAI